MTRRDFWGFLQIISKNDILVFLGIGGNSNTEDKQIRFWDFGYYRGPWRDNNRIVFSVENSSNNNSKWTLEELKDLINAFVQVCNTHVRTRACSGYLVLIDKETGFRE